MDDLNQVGKCLPYGTQYCKGRLYLPHPCLGVYVRPMKQDQKLIYSNFLVFARSVKKSIFIKFCWGLFEKNKILCVTCFKPFFFICWHTCLTETAVAPLIYMLHAWLIYQNIATVIGYLLRYEPGLQHAYYGSYVHFCEACQLVRPNFCM